MSYKRIILLLNVRSLQHYDRHLAFKKKLKKKYQSWFKKSRHYAVDGIYALRRRRYLRAQILASRLRNMSQEILLKWKNTGWIRPLLALGVPLTPLPLCGRGGCPGILQCRTGTQWLELIYHNKNEMLFAGKRITWDQLNLCGYFYLVSYNPN